MSRVGTNKTRDCDITMEQPDHEPMDTVSQIVWDPNRLGFIASSWDGYIRYYQIEKLNRATYGINTPK